MPDFDFESVYAPSPPDYELPQMPSSAMDAFLRKRQADAFNARLAEERAVKEATDKNREMVGLPRQPTVLVDPHYLAALPAIAAQKSAQAEVPAWGGEYTTDDAAPYSQPISLPPAAQPSKAKADSNSGAVMPGAAAQMQSKSALDSLMEQLSSHRQAKAEDDKTQMWLNFFSKMGSSKSPSLGGAIAEGATSIGPTIQAQSSANRAAEEKALEDQIALEKYKQSYGLEGRKVSADELRAKAAMAEAGASAAYRSKMIDAMGGQNIKMLNAQISAAKATVADINATESERKDAQIFLASVPKMAINGQSDLSGDPMTVGASDPLGLRGPK